MNHIRAGRARFPEVSRCCQPGGSHFSEGYGEVLNALRLNGGVAQIHETEEEGHYDEDEETELLLSEVRSEEPEWAGRHEKTYWLETSGIRATLRAARYEAARRQVALTWSGYVVMMQEMGRLPPRHGAWLMGELAPWLRKGDPWERIARSVGLEVEELAPVPPGARFSDLIARLANEDRAPSGNVNVDISGEEPFTEATAAEGALRAFALDAEAAARGERPHGPIRKLRIIGRAVDET